MMRRKIMILLGIIAASTLCAAPKPGFGPSWRKIFPQRLTEDEQALFVKLGNNQRRIFALMNGKQRQEVVAAAKEAATADAAVEQILKEHHLTFNGELETIQ